MVQRMTKQRRAEIEETVATFWGRGDYDCLTRAVSEALTELKAVEEERDAAEREAREARDEAGRWRASRDQELQAAKLLQQQVDRLTTCLASAEAELDAARQVASSCDPECERLRKQLEGAALGDMQKGLEIDALRKALAQSKVDADELKRLRDHAPIHCGAYIMFSDEKWWSTATVEAAEKRVEAAEKRVDRDLALAREELESMRRSNVNRRDAIVDRDAKIAELNARISQLCEDLDSNDASRRKSEERGARWAISESVSVLLTGISGHNGWTADYRTLQYAASVLSALDAREVCTWGQEAADAIRKLREARRGTQKTGE